MPLHAPGQKKEARGERRGDEKGGMVMKKLVILVAALLLIAPISAMAGMTAFMDMDEMSNAELADTTGQTGITINQTLQLAGGYIAWGDNDGCGGTTTNQGWLTLNNITASAIVLNGMTIDVCTATGETTTWLTIGIPAQTVTAGVSEIKVGSAANAGPSMGELVIHSLTVANMTVQITGHN
jgi:hypothetical protein